MTVRPYLAALQLAMTVAATGQSARIADNHWLFICPPHRQLRKSIKLGPSAIYDEGPRYGFDLGTAPAVGHGSCSSDTPFFFSVAVPEGNYKVKVKLGNDKSASTTTVKAESRRLMLFAVTAAPREIVERAFNVNVRTKYISPARAEASEQVHLKPREIGALDWDDKLTLEFSGQRPSVRSIEINRAADVPTLYLAGDSTVVDQDKEPWAAWGQMLPHFFDDTVSFSNQAESGETIRSFIAENRLAKIASTVRAGDYLFIQFAHNDQKAGAGLVTIPEYKQYLAQYIGLARQSGATPVLVTSMNRRVFDGEGKIVDTLGGYPEAMREVAKEQYVALIDLNAMSKTLFEAMGPEGTLKAFVHFPANAFPDQPAALADNTHFTSYGAYELARCVVNGVRDAHLPVASAIVNSESAFDPADPDSFASFILPQDPQLSAATPYGR